MRPGFGVHGSGVPVIDSPQLDQLISMTRPTPQLVDPVDKPEQRSCCDSGLCVGERGALRREARVPHQGLALQGIGLRARCRAAANRRGGILATTVHTGSPSRLSHRAVPVTAVHRRIPSMRVGCHP